MPKILLDHADGQYSTRTLSDEEAAQLEAQGVELAYVEDRVLAAWHRHCDEGAAWQALWRAVSNEQHWRRRQAELRPLEEAERTIEQLREELARAQRVSKHFEGEYQRMLGEQHRDEHVQFTCVYPQPGCDVAVLPPEWRERATELLESYDAQAAGEGLLRQGCCCGHDHRRLDDAEVQALRDGGFLVEHDSEPA